MFVSWLALDSITSPTDHRPGSIDLRLGSLEAQPPGLVCSNTLTLSLTNWYKSVSTSQGGLDFIHNTSHASLQPLACVSGPGAQVPIPEHKGDGMPQQGQVKGPDERVVLECYTLMLSQKLEREPSRATRGNGCPEDPLSSLTGLIPPDGTFIVPPQFAWRKGTGTLCLGAHAYVKCNILILPSQRKHLKYTI